MTTRRSLDDRADVRAGDKRDTLMLAVFPRDAAAFGVIRRELIPWACQNEAPDRKAVKMAALIKHSQRTRPQAVTVAQLPTRSMQRSP